MGRHGLHAAHPRAWEKHHVLPVKGLRSHRRMNYLIKHLATENDPKRRLQMLVYEIRRSPHMFSGNQVLAIAPYFQGNLIIALHLLDHHLLGVTCNVGHQILMLLTAPEQKLEALKVLSEHILDPINRQELITALPNISVLRQQAQSILDQVRGSSHVYGRIKAKSVIFLIDVSGSMGTEFRSECGSNFNRMEFVVHDLHKILHHRVPPDFRFNIFTFNENVHKWKWAQQFANRPNLKEAEHYLDHLQEGGGTNTHDALRTALQEPDVEAIYVLSDGEPTSGITNIDAIINDLRTWLAQRPSPVTIHAIAFLMGHDFNDPNPRRLMAGIAAAGGGVFRCIDNFAPDDEDHGDFMESTSDLKSAMGNDASFQQFFDNRMATVPQSAIDACKASMYANLPPPPNWKGNLVSRSRNVAEVTVPKVEDRKLSGHHVYDVHVILDGVIPDRRIEYTIPKSYNEFKDLHTKVKSQAGNDLVHFPGEHFFEKHDQQFLDHRRTQLEQWLQSVYVTYGPFANSDLGDFLMYGTYVDEAIAEAVDIYQAHQLTLAEAQQVPPPGYAPNPTAPPPLNPYIG